MIVKQKPIKSAFFILTAVFLIFSPVRSFQQAVNEDYTKKIKEHTTEDFFLTELVNHLPASDSVPTPEDILGVIAGAPDVLHYTGEIEKYLKAVAESSPRMVVFSIGKSDEGKNQPTAALSSEKNINRIERIKEILARLADPRNLDDSEVQDLLNEGVPVYWITGGLHSTECGSPEMLMELAYRLAVDESDFYQKVRDNLIVLITPVLEVDGRDRYVDTYMYKKEHNDKKTIPLVYWGNYVAHDNNRDNIGLALELTQNLLNTYFDWHPFIMHDLHESVPYLYTSTGTGPYNAWLDPITINEWHELAHVEVSEMNKQGVPGVWTHGFYNGWAPSYAFYIAMYHNSIGKFYETFGGTGADTLTRRVGGQSQRAWYRQNPPLPVVKWSFRNNINLQQSALLYALKHVADNNKKFLNNFYLKSKRSVAKAVTEGPVAWVIPEDGRKPLAAAGLVNLLRKHGVEVHRADEKFEIEKADYPAQSYVIRMDQPYSRCADMLLDTQYFNPNDPSPYDDTGWTLGPLHDVKTVRITDQEILNVPMELISEDVQIKGEVINKKRAKAYVINHRAENELMKMRFDLKDFEILAAESSFKIKEQSFNRGAFIIPVDEDNPEFLSRLEDSVKRWGLKACGTKEIPDVKSHKLAVPRIAILHTWISTQNEGWFRLSFERLGIPYSYISVHDIKNTKDLRDNYDVIIFPPVMLGKAQRLVNGVGGETPVPWEKTEKYPNLGGPDSIDDIRGGMGIEGVVHLKNFIENGGLFIPITSNASLPIDYGLVESVAVVNTRNLRMSGSVLQAKITDKMSPVTYGYNDTLGVYFSGSPVLETGIKAFTGGADLSTLFGGGGEGRASGRGGIDDPDVIQGRPYEWGKAKGAAVGIPPEYKDLMALFMPPDLQKVRVLLRFDKKEDLLISGMMRGAEELQNKPAVIDVSIGKGHVLFFAINPMWRHETHGSFSLLFNAALNFDHLDAGRRKPDSDEKKEEKDK